MFEGHIGNAPHVHRGRALLDSRGMVSNAVAVFEKYRARLGQTFTVHFGGVKLAVVSTDPVVIEHVLRGNRDNYEKSYIQVERMVEFQGQGLVNIHGAAWLRQRKLLAQGFKPGHIAKLLPMQHDVLEELMLAFDRDARQGPVDVRQQMVRFTLRLVGKSIFGRSMRDKELERIGEIIFEIQKFVHRQIVQPWMVPWFRLSGLTEKHQRLRREGDAIALRHIRARLSEGLGENDFLRILTETTYHDTGQRMDEPLALIECLQLLVAGNETSTNALTWIFYVLARHPRHILEIRDEVAAVIGDNAIDYRNLHRLEGTVRVIDEALRLYPPFLDDRPRRARGRRDRWYPHSGWSDGHSVHLRHTPQPGALAGCRDLRSTSLRGQSIQGAAFVRVHSVRWRPPDLHRQQPGGDADAHDRRGLCAKVRFRAGEERAGRHSAHDDAAASRRGHHDVSRRDVAGWLRRTPASNTG
jgi:cytochrome P450